MADFNGLKGRAHRDVAIYAAVYNLAHGGAPAIWASAIAALLPGALGGRQDDGGIEPALKPHIVKRDGTVAAHGHKATSWCQWAADFRELALSALRGAIFRSRGMSVTDGLLAQLHNPDILIDLTSSDRLEKLQQLMPYLPAGTVGMPLIDQPSINVEIDMEILSAIDEASQNPGGAGGETEAGTASPTKPPLGPILPIVHIDERSSGIEWAGVWHSCNYNTAKAFEAMIAAKGQPVGLTAILGEKPSHWLKKLPAPLRDIIQRAAGNKGYRTTIFD